MFMCVYTHKAIKQMKRILIIAIFITTSHIGLAKYRPLKLYEMIIKAEKIVYGTITKLDSTHFTLQIEGSLTSDAGVIRIARFEDWTCAQRWTKYEVGQRLLLFLTTVDGELVSMSGGNEGELPIIEDSVFINGFSITFPPPPGKTWSDDLIYFEPYHFKIYDADYFGIKWDLSSLLTAAGFIRDCFDFTYGQFGDPIDWHVKCPEDQLEEKRSESKLINWVYAETIKNNER